MAALFPGFNMLVKRLITERGQPLTLYRESTTSYSPATSEITSVSISTTGNGYLSEYEFSEVDNKFVFTTDSKLLMHQVDFAPEQNDEVEIDNDLYRVLSVRKVMVEGKTPLYICQVRK